MFHVILLICALGTNPWECTSGNALRTIDDGTIVANKHVCGRWAARLAATALVIHPGEVARLICDPVTDTAMSPQ